MKNLMITIEQDISAEARAVYDKFSEDNWGDRQHEDEAENKLNFFDKPTYWVIGRIDSEVVGLLLVFGRKINFGGKKVKLAGIGGVLTHKEWRRKGVASKMLQYTFENRLKLEDFDIAMLCTDIEKLEGLYGKVGFVPLGRKYYFVNKNGEERPEEGGMIALVNSREILEKILESTEKLFVGMSNF